MFHVLTDKETVLKWDNAVQCGIKFRREAISIARYKQYKASGSLVHKRMCKACKRALEGNKYEPQSSNEQS